MAGFKRILFPVDFSPRCELAAAHVALFARKFSAEIELLHSESLPAEPYVWESQAELLAKRLAEFAHKKLAGLDVQTFVTIGEPAEQIVSCARDKHAGLIMMPTHGRGPFRRFVLGSVTTKVLHDAPCPVWMSAHLAQERPPTDLRSILCAVDLDGIGEHTLEYAAELARMLDARLAIAHAVPAVEVPPDVYLDSEFQGSLIESAKTRLAEMQAAVSTPSVLCVGAGNIARFVANTAKTQNAGLVIISRGGHGMLGRLRTHDYAIIRECECPVLSL